MFGRRALTLFLGICLNCAPAFAQDDPCLRRTVPVNALTDQGRRYADLAADEVHASLKGKPLSIISVKPSTAAPRVMIVIDASASMQENQKGWSLNLSIARALLQSLPDDSLAGLAVFSKAIGTHIPASRDREALTAELDRLTASRASAPHATALWDAMSVTVAEAALQ
jgi:hypothetical protein